MNINLVDPTEAQAEESYQIKIEEPDEQIMEVEQSKETSFENNKAKGNIGGLFGDFYQVDQEKDSKEEDAEIDKFDMISIELTKSTSRRKSRVTVIKSSLHQASNQSINMK